jgi:hypothetical protein
MELGGQNIDRLWASRSDIYVLAAGLGARSGSTTVTGVIAINTLNWCI